VVIRQQERGGYSVGISGLLTADLKFFCDLTVRSVNLPQITGGSFGFCFIYFVDYRRESGACMI